MRAAPGVTPRAIARLSRRIDIAKALFDGTKGADYAEPDVNPVAVRHVVIAAVAPGKGRARLAGTARKCP